MSASHDASAPDRDVVVVGGGPAGCSAGVFTARYGLDTAILDRGRSSIRRCAHLENYLGFPAGIDVETLYGLMHDHAAEAGCEIVPERVETVDRAGHAAVFVVETGAGRQITARRVVAATRYDAGYLRPLAAGTLFETADGADRERFDRSAPDADGTTPVERLYVASPSTEADRQAIVAAGRGARVGLAVVRNARRERGYPAAVADHYDWMRRAAERDAGERDERRERFDERLPDDHGLGEERRVELREREVDRSLGAYLPDEEIDRRAERAHERLLDHVDDDLILERAREIDARGGSPEVSDPR